MSRKWLFIGFLLMALGVGIGAFGAHGLKARLSPYYLGIFEKGVLYHYLHSFGIIVASLAGNYINKKWADAAALLLFLGVCAFSGSLYLLATAEILGIQHWKWLGPITPIGGTCFIMAWLILAVAVWKGEHKKVENE